MGERLFAIDAWGVKWSEFKADGFQNLVPGIIYKSGKSECGLPLGGIGTGCIDLDTDGTFGRCSIFNSFAPPRVLNTPFLGLTLGNQVYCLSTRPPQGVKPVKQIYYWGHYPIADLEYEVDDPVSAGVRAWCPFAPGDADISNTPAICFEVRVRNLANDEVKGSIVISFPGPSSDEARAANSTRKHVGHRIKGKCVRAGGADYTLAVVGDVEPRFGGPLAKESDWIHLPVGLPSTDGTDPGSSLAVDFEIAPAQEEKITVILAWYSPRWAGSPVHHFWHAYHQRFHDSPEVAEFLAQNKDNVLARILRWQAAIYDLPDFPAWLRDQLVNILHTIPEDSLWASDSIPKEDWYGSPGLFGMIESPRTTPHACNPSDWYGGLPIVFFFPELAAALLRSYVHFQLPNGEIPLGIGEGADLAHPVYHLIHTLNSCVHIHLVDRLWQRDRDLELLREFYPSVRSALAYMKGLDRDADGLADLEPDPIPNQFYNSWPWHGTAVHVDMFWLAAIAMVERMAEEMGDSATQQQCRSWQQLANRSLEDKLWTGNYYLLYVDSESGRRSDTVLANQLAGEWCARLHGLTEIFPPGNVSKTLQMVQHCCMPLTTAGILNAARPDGSPDRTAPPQSDGIFTGEALCVAETMAYSGQTKAALQIAENLFNAIVLRDRREWDMPNILDSAGNAIHGTDFYQMMMLWALPLALRAQNLHEACSQGQLIDRVIRAASAKAHSDV
ncbi:MAG TPA: GH116 family glycosyl hydrolase [Terriglobia bacterium]|nr:GH116 family glycosyl hydrolase [Terriglobia bacterium]